MKNLEEIKEKEIEKTVEEFHEQDRTIEEEQMEEVRKENTEGEKEEKPNSKNRKTLMVTISILIIISVVLGIYFFSSKGFILANLLKKEEIDIQIPVKEENITAECQIEVNPIEVTQVTLDETNVTIGKGNEYILSGSVVPDNATDKSIIWMSSNNEIITVDNGIIKAISNGNAEITIMSNNGKTAICKFNVIEVEPNHEIKYVRDEYNIRSEPNTEYGIIAEVNRNEEIQILKELKDWSKVRTINGTVGYIISNGYSAGKTYLIENVPFYDQNKLGYPTGCEAVSAAMVARYFGYQTSIETIIDNTPTDARGIWKETITVQKEVQKEENNQGNSEEAEDNIEDSNISQITSEIIEETVEVTYGGNPFEVFVGHPTKKYAQGSYGCFAEPIVVALKKSGVSCSNISGCSQQELLNYIEQGKPIVVWGTKNAKDIVIGETWTYPDNTGTFTKLTGEHCMVLIGYDGENIYLNDPSAGANVSQPRDKFFENWNQLYKQAIAIN